MTAKLPPLPPGFRQTGGKRSPPRDGSRYFIQLRQGFADMNNTYTAEQLRWAWTLDANGEVKGDPGDVVAVKNA